MLKIRTFGGAIKNQQSHGEIFFGIGYKEVDIQQLPIEILSHDKVKQILYSKRTNVLLLYCLTISMFWTRYSKALVLTDKCKTSRSLFLEIWFASRPIYFTHHTGATKVINSEKMPYAYSTLNSHGIIRKRQSFWISTSFLHKSPRNHLNFYAEVGRRGALLQHEID